jgi:DNA-binding transcriptional ArsR family regulator
MHGMTHDVEVIDSPAAATVALDPVRARLLAELADPASAAQLAERVGLTRQKVNYHLRLLESHGLVQQVQTRRHGGLTERLLVASASSFVISPAALGESACDPARARDRLSARYLVALAARLIHEVGALARDEDGARLSTLTVDTEIAFRSPAERAAFADDLAAAVTQLSAKYHDPAGRPHRLVVAAHPIPQSPEEDPA